jgi:zinc finger protein
MSNEQTAANGGAGAAPAPAPEPTAKSLFVPLAQVAEDTSAAAAPEQAGAGEHGGDSGDASDEERLPSNVTREAGGDVMAIKSLCVACEGEGTTRLLLTRIPFFRDVILMAFDCEECGYRNSEVQSAEVQEKGCRFEVKVETPQVRMRDAVASEREAANAPLAGQLTAARAAARI